MAWKRKSSHRSSIEADTIEEERRLAYVGITRARQTLAFTCRQAQAIRRNHRLCPSRFLDELPPHDLAWEGNDDTLTEVKAVRGNTALADIRAMLKARNRLLHLLSAHNAPLEEAFRGSTAQENSRRRHRAFRSCVLKVDAF